MKKDFDNFSEDQLNEFYEIYVQVIKKIEDFFYLLKNNKEYQEAFSKAPPSSNFYELPLSVTVGLIVIGFGLTEEIQDIANSENSLKGLNSFMANLPNGFTPKKSLSSEEALLVLSAIKALSYQIIAINMHGKSLSDLVVIANEGKDNALFDVVMIDHSAVSIPSIAKRIQTAQSIGDTNFNINLTKAISDNKPKRHRPHKADDALRYMLTLISEQFGIGSKSKTVTYEKLYDLLAEDLKLYPRGNKEGSVSAFEKYIQRYRNKYRT